MIFGRHVFFHVTKIMHILQGLLVYYANQIYVNRGLFETMTVGLLKHAIFTNHSLQKHKILSVMLF